MSNAVPKKVSITARDVEILESVPKKGQFRAREEKGQFGEAREYGC